MRWGGLARELRSHGVKVRATRGWKRRGGPANFIGVLDHHTASPRNSGAAPSLGYVTTGSPIAPLCNLLIGRDLTVHLVARGKANHAGLGGPWRGVPRDSGNFYLIGVEIENDGVGEPWDEDLMGVVYIVNAVLLRRMDEGAGKSGGHKEYAPRRKIDPARINMDAFRKRVRRRFRLVGGRPKRRRRRRGPRTPLLVVGARGKYVKRVQRRLTRDGFRTEPDGIFGPKTKRRVKEFQRKHRLAVDGIVGRRTWAALLKV